MIVEELKIFKDSVMKGTEVQGVVTGCTRQSQKERKDETRKIDAEDKEGGGSF